MRQNAFKFYEEGTVWVRVLSQSAGQGQVEVIKDVRDILWGILDVKHGSSGHLTTMTIQGQVQWNPMVSFLFWPRMAIKCNCISPSSPAQGGGGVDTTPLAFGP